MTSKKKLLILTLMGNALIVSNTTKGAILLNNPNNSQIHEQTISATTQDAIQNLAETAPELILQYTFSSTNDESGIYNGQLGGSAKLSTLNNIPILELGNNNGYFDMGENVGDVISSLNEAFTISMNVFIPSNYGLGQNGNFIFNFGLEKLNRLTTEEANFAQKFARFVNERNVIGIMEELGTAQRDIEQNVNPRFVFFDFALKMIVLLIR